MFPFFILFLGIYQNDATSLIYSGNGSLDELDACHCSVVLPDSTFPADRFEKLEISNHNFSISVEQEVTKIHHYESTLIIYMERMLSLTKRVEEMEKGGQSFTKLDYELVKMEINEMESLIQQLQSSMNGTNVVAETLYQEIRNLSIMVSQLEVYDKNNVLVTRKEVVTLKEQLKDCEKNQSNTTLFPQLPPLDNGTCQHGLIVNISRPYLVQLNYNGTSYIYGGWGRDSFVGANQNVHWVAPLNTDGRTLNFLRTYNSYNDLLVYKHAMIRTIPKASFGQGGGMIMYNNLLYYNCFNSQNLCKYNPQLNGVELIVSLPNAASNNQFSYSSSVYQDIDMAADEEGLWVIYSTEANAGNIVLSRIDPISLVVQQTWTTSLYKPAATNAFMVCGVLYATRAISLQKEEIFYMYDTKTRKEGWMSVPLEKPREKVQSLSYNPNDHKLYMYNDGYLVTYALMFNPLHGGKSGY